MEMRVPACAAAAFEPKPGQNGDVFDGRDLVATSGAGRARREQVVASGRIRRFFSASLGGFVSPGALEDDRQTMNDDIQKAADEQA
jgi:hypothetical protein